MRNPICWSTGSFFSAFFSWAGGSLSSFCHPPPLQPSATSACTGGQRLVGEEPTMNSSICFRISAACPAAAFCPRSGPRSIVLQVLIIKARPFSFKCNTSCRILTELAGPGERWHSGSWSRASCNRVRPLIWSRGRTRQAGVHRHAGLRLCMRRD